MTAQATRLWVVIVVVTASVLLYALALAGNDIDRLERRIDKLEAVTEAQGDLILELTDAYLVSEP